jgi:serine/threonine-protein kinase
VLAPELAADAAFRDRLRVEARAAAQLCHPHITAVYDYGEWAQRDAATVPYVVMELIDGESVAARLRRGPMPWRAAVVASAEIAAALAAAHTRGVVHRDVTPFNVMLTAAGAKVLDFGISALVGERDGGPDGSLLGTPAYLAPERLRGGAVSAATDVYALGVLLYRALTGRLPWRAETTTDILKAHLHAAPAALPELPGMPPEVAELCLSCLAKQPEDRPSSADAARRLAAAAGTTSILPVTTDVSDARTTMPPWSGAGRRAVHDAGPAAAAGSAAPAGARSVAGSANGGAVPGGNSSARRRPGGSAPSAAASAPAAAASARAVSAAASRPPVRGAGRPPATPARRRARAAAVAVGVLAASGLAWSAWTYQDGADPVQAAAGPDGLGGLGGAGVPCQVAYDVTEQTATGFGARLAVTNGGERALNGWKLRFSFSGDQRVLAGDGYLVAQNGRQVVIRPVGAASLQPDATVRLLVQGSYRAANPAPADFTLDGRSCAVPPASPGTTTLAGGAGTPGGLTGLAGGTTDSGGVAAGGAVGPDSGTPVSGGSGPGGGGSPGSGAGSGSGSSGGTDSGGGNPGGGNPGGGNPGGGNPGGGSPGGGSPGGGNPGGGNPGGGNPGGGNPGGGDKPEKDKGGKPDKDKGDKGKGGKPEKDKGDKGEGGKPEKDKGGKPDKDKSGKGKGGEGEGGKPEKDKGDKGKGGGKSGAGVVPDLPLPSLPVVADPL